MNLMESVKIALNAIWVNKMRSLLTMLGIIIGIASVIAVVALGHGSEALFNKEFETFGITRAYVTYNYEEEMRDKDYMTHADVESIKRNFDGRLNAVSINYSVGATIVDLTKRSKKTNVSLQGVDSSYTKIEKIKLIQGRFLTENDVTANGMAGVIDSEFAQALFGRQDVIGEILTFSSGEQTISLKIVGVYEQPKSSLNSAVGYTPPKVVYAPYTTLERTFNSDDRVYAIELTVANKDDVNAVSDDIKKLLKRKHNTDKEIYQVFTAQKQLDSINSVLGVLTMVISAIAAISLVVGGIGVMNIMLVSVTERTREIGIRKSLGATRKDILTQFLVEAVFISGIGGIIGTILGIGLSYGLSLLIKVPPSTSPTTIAIAWLFSAGVGIFFGIYPANKAAKLDPIEALRYE